MSNNEVDEQPKNSQEDDAPDSEGRIAKEGDASVERVMESPTPSADPETMPTEQAEGSTFASGFRAKATRFWRAHQSTIAQGVRAVVLTAFAVYALRSKIKGATEDGATSLNDDDSSTDHEAEDRLDSSDGADDPDKHDLPAGCNTKRNSPIEHQVRTHTRHQAYGSNWSEHREIAIEGYTRGGNGSE